MEVLPFLATLRTSTAPLVEATLAQKSAKEISVSFSVRTQNQELLVTFSSAQYPIFLGTIIGFGQITDYKFSDVLNSPNINTINIQGSYQAPINQNIFLLPSQSFTIPILGPAPGLATIGHKYVVRAAVSFSLSFPTFFTSRHSKLTLISPSLTGSLHLRPIPLNAHRTPLVRDIAAQHCRSKNPQPEPDHDAKRHVGLI